jgi:protein-tyrosine kinase
MKFWGKSKKTKLDNKSVKYGVNLVANDYPTSAIAEQFRTVMTNISYVNVNHDMKSLIITSSDPSEGKSTFAANLAITYAKQGRNVVLVDADMRRPTVHKSFRISNQVGLSSVLSGNASIEDSVQYTNIPHLSVITSGPIPPNPSSLLGNKSLKSIFSKYNHPNDLVILDVPPVNTMTDASIIAAIADATLLVIPQGIAEKKSTKLAVDQLNKVKANVIGAVMNRAASNNENNYYYYYSK